MRKQNFLMIKMFTVLLLVVGVFCGCDQRTSGGSNRISPKNKLNVKIKVRGKDEKTKSRAAKTKTTKKTNDTSVGDVIDYGIGMTPLKIKQKKSKMLKDINKARNDRLQAEQDK